MLKDSTQNIKNCEGVHRQVFSFSGSKNSADEKNYNLGENLITPQRQSSQTSQIQSSNGNAGKFMKKWLETDENKQDFQRKGRSVMSTRVQEQLNEADKSLKVFRDRSHELQARQNAMKRQCTGLNEKHKRFEEEIDDFSINTKQLQEYTSEVQRDLQRVNQNQTEVAQGTKDNLNELAHQLFDQNNIILRLGDAINEKDLILKRISSDSKQVKEEVHLKSQHVNEEHSQSNKLIIQSNEGPSKEDQKYSNQTELTDIIMNETKKINTTNNISTSSFTLPINQKDTKEIIDTKDTKDMKETKHAQRFPYTNTRDTHQIDQRNFVQYSTFGENQNKIHADFQKQFEFDQNNISHANSTKFLQFDINPYRNYDISKRIPYEVTSKPMSHEVFPPTMPNLFSKPPIPKQLSFEQQKQINHETFKPTIHDNSNVQNQSCYDLKERRIDETESKSDQLQAENAILSDSLKCKSEQVESLILKLEEKDSTNENLRKQIEEMVKQKKADNGYTREQDQSLFQIFDLKEKAFIGKIAILEASLQEKCISYSDLQGKILDLENELTEQRKITQQAELNASDLKSLLYHKQREIIDLRLTITNSQLGVSKQSPQNSMSFAHSEAISQNQPQISFFNYQQRGSFADKLHLNNSFQTNKGCFFNSLLNKKVSQNPPLQLMSNDEIFGNINKYLSN